VPLRPRLINFGPFQSSDLVPVPNRNGKWLVYRRNEPSSSFQHDKLVPALGRRVRSVRRPTNIRRRLLPACAGTVAGAWIAGLDEPRRPTGSHDATAWFRVVVSAGRVLFSLGTRYGVARHGRNGHRFIIGKE
jgi:hypothetical protein